MNRHLIGPPAGLPLDCLEAEDLWRDKESKPYMWTQTWRASIINDELMLSAVHKFSQFGVGDIFARSFKKGLHCRASSEWSTWLCSHVRINSDIEMPCVAKKGLGTTELDLFVPCRDVESSCPSCLTDFNTTITWIGDVSEAVNAQKHSEKSGQWSIVVTTYHQLGKCRSPTIGSGLRLRAGQLLVSWSDERKASTVLGPSGVGGRNYRRKQASLWSFKTVHFFMDAKGRKGG